MMRQAIRRHRGRSIALLLLGFSSAAQAQSVSIVGTGSVTCERYLDDVTRDPLQVGQYFAWAQGYMSAALRLAPAGVDDDLNLTPKALPVLDQMAFVHDFCRTRPREDYSDAVHALHRRLRGKVFR